MWTIMGRLSKEDLTQMNRDYFQSLEKETLVEVAESLHQLAVEQWEKINSNSGNSSQPPSSDNPFKKSPSSKTSTQDSSKKAKKNQELKTEPSSESPPKKKPGRQLGSKGFGRSQPLKVSVIIPHYPQQCSACNQTMLTMAAKPFMGHHVLDLDAVNP